MGYGRRESAARRLSSSFESGGPLGGFLFFFFFFFFFFFSYLEHAPPRRLRGSAAVKQLDNVAVRDPQEGVLMGTVSSAANGYGSWFLARCPRSCTLPFHRRQVRLGEHPGAVEPKKGLSRQLGAITAGLLLGPGAVGQAPLPSLGGCRR